MIGMGSEASHLDPMRSNDSASQYAYNLIFDRLVTLDASLKPRRRGRVLGDVAGRADLHLQAPKGVNFTDGSPLTSEDVKFSFDRILYPAKRVRQAVVHQHDQAGRRGRSGR